MASKANIWWTEATECRNERRRRRWMVASDDTWRDQSTIGWWWRSHHGVVVPIDRVVFLMLFAWREWSDEVREPCKDR